MSVETKPTDPAAPADPSAETATGMVILTGDESCECLHCNETIANYAVAKQIIGPVNSPPMQRVRAYCEHCDVLYQMDRFLRDGHWVMRDRVRIITDKNARAAFLRRIDFLKGNRQRSAS
jgi:hypothetical protein